MKRKKAPTVDISLSAEALGLPFSEKDWKATPTVVRHFIIECEKASVKDRKTIAKLSEHVEELERRIEELLNRDSSNSDQPPSSDGPYRKPRVSKPKFVKILCNILILLEVGSFFDTTNFVYLVFLITCRDFNETPNMKILRLRGKSYIDCSSIVGGH